MNLEEAIQIVSSLADGVDPHTGEIFPKDSPYQHPDTVRALYKAIMALDRWSKYEARRSRLPPNAGKAWSPDEEKELIEGFESGLSLLELAKKHSRTTGAIRARLEKLGKIEFLPSSP